MVQALLRRASPILGGRRLLELHDGRRSGAREGVISGQLRPLGRDQEEVRSHKLLPRESEHSPGVALEWHTFCLTAREGIRSADCKGARCQPLREPPAKTY